MSAVKEAVNTLVLAHVAVHTVYDPISKRLKDTKSERPLDGVDKLFADAESLAAAVRQAYALEASGQPCKCVSFPCECKHHNPTELKCGGGPVYLDGIVGHTKQRQTSIREDKRGDSKNEAGIVEVLVGSALPLPVRTCRPTKA